MYKETTSCGLYMYTSSTKHTPLLSLELLITATVLLAYNNYTYWIDILYMYTDTGTYMYMYMYMQLLPLDM